MSLKKVLALLLLLVFSLSSESLFAKPKKLKKAKSAHSHSVDKKIVKSKNGHDKKKK